MVKPSIPHIENESRAEWNKRYQKEYYRLNREAKGKSVKPRPDAPVIPLEVIEGETKQQRKKRYGEAYYLANREKAIADAAEARRKNADDIRQKQKERYARERAAILERNSEYYRRNKEAIAAQNKVWRAANKDLLKAYEERNAERKALVKAAWYAKNTEKSRQRCAEWLRKNQAKARANAAQRRSLELMACPAWADLSAIMAVYVESRRLKAETGIVHHVDHIVPLKHKTVCGLHVHWNLRAIPAVENQRKKNRLIECLLQPPEASSLSP